MLGLGLGLGLGLKANIFDLGRGFATHGLGLGLDTQSLGLVPCDIVNITGFMVKELFYVKGSKSLSYWCFPFLPSLFSLFPPSLSLPSLCQESGADPRLMGV